MSNDDHPPRARPAGAFWLLRFAAILLVLCGMAWGVSEHDAVMSSAAGVAPPVDDAPRNATSIDVQRPEGERAVATPAASAPMADATATAVVAETPTTGVCGAGCTGPPTLRGPPGA